MTVSLPGATLSQLSDSGQTLSEDSGVDIAEAGGLSKDGSPRPSKNQRRHLEQPGAQFYPTSGAVRQVSVSRCPNHLDTSYPILRSQMDQLVGNKSVIS